MGLRWGALLQNVSTWTKFVAMSAFVILGFAIGKGHWSNFRSHGVGLTMGLEPVAIRLGTGSRADCRVLGIRRMGLYHLGGGRSQRAAPQCSSGDGVGHARGSRDLYGDERNLHLRAAARAKSPKHETIAHAAAAALFSPHAAVWLSAMIAISCFSAAATCTLSGARVCLAMAQDGVFFRSMAKIHPKWRTPAFGLIGQGIWAAVLAVSGRYDQLYTYVIYGMVLSYTLTVIGLFILRWKRPDDSASVSLCGLSVDSRRFTCWSAQPGL